MPSDLPITFYLGDPLNERALRLITIDLDTLLPPDSCVQLQYSLPKIDSGRIFIVVNDDGSKPTPLMDRFPLTAYTECEYGNNFDEVLFDVPNRIPDLGPDLVLCNDSSIVLDAGPGFSTYMWQDGSADQTYVTRTGGIFWVEVTDACDNVIRDSILIVREAPEVDTW